MHTYTCTHTHMLTYVHVLLQTYVDVCLSGCLEHGDDFAREFIATTFLWAPWWLNERELARRPWLHQKDYVKIDRCGRRRFSTD